MIKLVEQYNNIYYHSIKKKPIDADYSTFTEKFKTNHNTLKVKVNDRVRITKYKNIFSKGYSKNRSREVFIIDSVLKTTLRKKFPYSELFWSTFSGVRTEFGEIQSEYGKM